jgi:hypothetical protein
VPSDVQRELDAHNTTIELAKVAQSVISHVHQDKKAAAELCDKLISLGKQAGLMTEGDIPAIKKALSTQAGTAKIAMQILEEVVEQAKLNKSASASSGNNSVRGNGFAVGNPTIKKTASYGGYDGEDVIGSEARRMR